MQTQIIKAVLKAAAEPVKIILWFLTHIRVWILLKSLAKLVSAQSVINTKKLRD